MFILLRRKPLLVFSSFGCRVIASRVVTLAASDPKPFLSVSNCC